jgi:PPOX class probable F420-dependent enzyme
VNRGLSVEQSAGLLDERRLAVMSTFRADGTVLLSPIWYIWEDGGFTIAMAAGDGKLKHLRRDPRVTIVVCEDELPYRGFELRGIARLLDVPYGPVIRRIATRYVGAEASGYWDDEHGGTVARIEPGEARGWDFVDDFTEMGIYP